MNKFIMDKDGHLTRNPEYNKKSNIMEVAYKLVNYINSLDDEGLEIFIRAGKETGNISDEEQFRKVLLDIRES